MSFWLTSAYFGLLLAYFGLLRLTSPKSQQPARGIHIGLRRTCSLPKNMKEKSLLVSASLNSKEPMIRESGLCDARVLVFSHRSPSFLIVNGGSRRACERRPRRADSPWGKRGGVLIP